MKLTWESPPSLGKNDGLRHRGVERRTTHLLPPQGGAELGGGWEAVQGPSKNQEHMSQALRGQGGLLCYSCPHLTLMRNTTCEHLGWTLTLHLIYGLMPSDLGINDSHEMSILNPFVHAFPFGKEGLLLVQVGVPKIKVGEFPTRALETNNDSELTRTV